MDLSVVFQRDGALEMRRGFDVAPGQARAWRVSRASSTISRRKASSTPSSSAPRRGWRTGRTSCSATTSARDGAARARASPRAAIGPSSSASSRRWTGRRRIPRPRAPPNMRGRALEEHQADDPRGLDLRAAPKERTLAERAQDAVVDLNDLSPEGAQKGRLLRRCRGHRATTPTHPRRGSSRGRSAPSRSARPGAAACAREPVALASATPSAPSRRARPNRGTRPGSVPRSKASASRYVHKRLAASLRPLRGSPTWCRRSPPGPACPRRRPRRSPRAVACDARPGGRARAR